MYIDTIGTEKKVCEMFWDTLRTWSTNRILYECPKVENKCFKRLVVWLSFTNQTHGIGSNSE